MNPQIPALSEAVSFHVVESTVRPTAADTDSFDGISSTALAVLIQSPAAVKERQTRRYIT